MTSAYAALVGILRVPATRIQAAERARAQEGEATAMGKLLADEPDGFQIAPDLAFQSHRTGPHWRLGRRGSDRVLDAGEIHQFLSAGCSTALRRDAQEKVGAPTEINSFLSARPLSYLDATERFNGESSAFSR